MKNKKISDIGDLTHLAKGLESVFSYYFGDGCTFFVLFNTPIDEEKGHWVTNVSREDGIKILEETLKIMKENNNAK